MVVCFALRAQLPKGINKIAKSNFATLRSDLNEFKQQIMDIRAKKSGTIQSEVMRSNQEVEIANFLYLNNVDYEYEPLYKYDIQPARKPYTPDFMIRQGNKVAYIEHFGITQDGKNDRFSEDELASYKKAINDKIALHKQHGTALIYTFSQYSDRRSLLEHLKEELRNQGFILTPRSNKEVMEKLITSEENRYIRKLVNLICRFITNFKTNETYGFPSKIEDDPVLAFVIKGDRSIDYAEERRLFYVAMTRTKNCVFFIAPEQNPSEFLLEIKKDYKNVVLRGNWNEEPPQNTRLRKLRHQFEND